MGKGKLLWIRLVTAPPLPLLLLLLPRGAGIRRTRPRQGRHGGGHGWYGPRVNHGGVHRSAAPWVYRYKLNLKLQTL
jgi:hypothetical protein